jgi:post-segregation antitoxin (ccd killing protein)
MPRIQVYVPSEMYAELKARDLPASQIFQSAVSAELERLRALDAVDEYLAELDAELGEPSAEDEAWAKGIVQRIDRHLGSLDR